MNNFLPNVQELFDAKGEPLGAILGPEAWALVREQILSRHGEPVPVREIAEPMGDWRDLVASWDFKYPVDLDVRCPLCGNETSDWEHDDPRKFMLTAANFGGLVTFRCLGCQAKIMKRHFKDIVKVEVKPFLPEKSARNLGRSK
ncbi:MAG: hypothetical protein AUJ49_02670 [Desulfovibrionaceae bacterium CG1_02_65_16]|nr:MAG: hypothetical protein AUJ49_02670 [Desulfovibrionaceae bacterium CG1_02_65_16]